MSDKDFEELILMLREDGFTEEEIEEIVMRIEDGHSVDAAIQWNME